MKNFDCITPNKEHLLICFFLCLALGLYADEKIDSIKAKEAPVVSDTVLRSIQYPTNALILPGVVVYGKYPKMKIKPFKNKKWNKSLRYLQVVVLTLWRLSIGC